MIILKEKYGQLGNRLWQFSHLLAFSKEYNLFISYPGFNDYADYFEGTKNNLFCSYPMIYVPFKIPKIVRKLIFNSVSLIKRILLKINKFNIIYKHIWVQPGHYYDLDEKEHIDVLTKYRIVTLEGWLIRGNNSFVKHNNFIRSYFKPINKYTKPVDDLISFIRGKHDIIIGVHIRRGDYELHKPENYYSFSEYHELLNSLSKLFIKKNIAFIIGSDEKIPQSVFTENNLYYTDGFFINDLYAFSKCDYIIGVVSTFTLWASFFGNVPLCVINKIDQEININSFKICNH